MSGSSSPPPLEPDNEFTFTCNCLNVHIVGHISPSTPIPPCTKPFEAGSFNRLVYLTDRSEVPKQPAYVNWENDARPSRRKSTTPDAEEEQEDSPSGPAWRKCWLCDTRLYESDGKGHHDEGVRGEWVTVDLSSGIIWGDVLAETLDSDDLLPYSGLKLDLPSSSSSFGRPPNAAPPSIYPRADEALANSHFISPVADPFFLPPPFIPSHPHLRNMCNEAVDYLRDKHLRLEDEVREFIAKKSREMRHLEDKVRVEVEVLWKRYEEVPGVEGLERSRSRSVTRDEERDKRRDATKRFTTARSPTSGSVISSGIKSPVGDITPRNPLGHSIQSITSPPAPGASSLLSASISANSFHAPPPPPQVADKIDDSIMTLSRTLDKRSDARAVAMSHVFSVLDDAMAGQAYQKRKESHSRTREPAKEADPSPVKDRNAGETDSWIEEERRLLAATDGEIAEAQEMDGRTPKPAQRKELSTVKEKDKEKEKERRAVKFEEPSKDEAGAGDDADDADVADQDEYVFDFEVDEVVKDDPTTTEAGSVPAPKESYISRTRNMVEANLSKTLAADAPSHRAAWRVIEQNSSIYHSLRRTSTDSLGSDTDSSTVSKLAMSMPMNIAAPRPARAASALVDLQRKTSLTDREGILVPSLIAAMRQRGIPSSNALGLSPSQAARPTREDQGASSHRKTTRSGSVSRDRERDTARSFAADPGAVFESMAEDAVVESDEEEDEDGEQEGTLRESGFIPPHVLARRRASQEGGAEVGWRSLATS